MKLSEFGWSGKGIKGAIRTVNARLPWLKLVLLLVLMLGVAVLVEEGLRRAAGQPVKTEVAEEVGEESEKELLGTKLPEIEKKNVIYRQGKKTPEVIPEVPIEQYAGQKLVALTFDDGPSGVTTPRLLRILQEKGVRATFFVVGTMARQSPDLLRQEVAAGHEVGSHTMSHANLPKVGVAGVQSEVAQMDELFMSILGKKPVIMRPPYGSVDDVVRANVSQPMIIWTVDPEDWKYRDAATVRVNVVRATFDGAIVLMHDIHGSTVDAVPGIIDDLRAQGYEFVTVSELARVRGVALERGIVYGSFRP